MEGFVGFVLVFVISMIVAALVSSFLWKRQNSKRGDKGRELRTPPNDITVDL